MSTSYFNISWDVQSYLLCNFTNGLTLGRCERVCKDWNDRIFKTQSLWKQIFERENGYLPSKPFGFNWRNFYIRHYLFCLNLLADNYGKPKFISLLPDVSIEGCEKWGRDGKKKKFFIYKKTLLLCGSKGKYYFDLELGILCKEPKMEKIRFSSIRRPMDWQMPLSKNKIKNLDENYFCCIEKRSIPWNSYSSYSFYEASDEKLVFYKTHNINYISHIFEDYFVFHNSQGKLEFWNWKKNIKINEMEGIAFLHQKGDLKVSKLSAHYLINQRWYGYIDVYDLLQGRKLYTIKCEQENEKALGKIYASKKNFVYVSDSGIKARAQIVKLTTGEICKENIYLKSRSDLQIFKEQLVGIPESDPSAIIIIDLDTGLLRNSFNVNKESISSFYCIHNRLIVTSFEELYIWNLETGGLIINRNFPGELSHFEVSEHYLGLICSFQNKGPLYSYYFFNWITGAELGHLADPPRPISHSIIHQGYLILPGLSGYDLNIFNLIGTDYDNSST